MPVDADAELEQEVGHATSGQKLRFVKGESDGIEEADLRFSPASQLALAAAEDGRRRREQDDDADQIPTQADPIDARRALSPGTPPKRCRA